ncbi:MAG: hypothetical protein V3T23_00270 [Nitrososphaerales archaeon]
MPKLKTLSLKQEAFAVAFVETGSPSQAYRLAYNAENMQSSSISVNASKLLQNTKIALRIANLRDALVAVDFDYVLDSFKAVYDRSMQDLPVYNNKGEPTGEYQFNAAGANKAMESIGRLKGYFIDRSESKAVSGTPEQYALAKALDLKYQEMSLDQLIELRDDQRKALGSG